MLLGPRSFRAAATMLALLATGVLTGCAAITPSPGATGTGVLLPNLSAAQAYRDGVARSESAIANASQSLVILATECDLCREVLQENAETASERLSALGGLWQPWPDATESELSELPMPDPVGEAPTRPALLVAFMLLTAQNQLAELPAVDGLSGAEASVIASTLAGRILAARTLAGFYDVDITQISKMLPEGALAGSVPSLTQPDADSPLPEETPTADQSGNGQQSGSTHSGDTPNTEARAAYHTFECATTTLSFTDLVTTNPQMEATIFDAITERLVVLDTQGVEPDRELRCVLDTTNTNELMAAIVGADLQLVQSLEPPLQELGLTYLQADILRWRTIGTPPLVTPGLTLNDTAPSD